MDRKLKFNFNSKEEELSFNPETFEDLKNLFLELYNEKSSKEINFKFIEENKEILLNNENYQNFIINENVDTIFVSKNLNNNFSNVNVESEYPIEDNRSYTLGETPIPEESSALNLNMDNPYRNKNEEENKIMKEELEKKMKVELEKNQKTIEELKKKNLELSKDKKEQNDLIKK